jgi:hypothetical protein
MAPGGLPLALFVAMLWASAFVAVRPTLHARALTPPTA